MANYDLTIVSTNSSPAKVVRDSNPVKFKPATLSGNEWELRVINQSMMKISGSVNSRNIDNQSHYNGYNDLVKKIDPSRTKVDNENGFLGFCCTKRTVYFYDNNGNELFKRHIDGNSNEISFTGVNGNKTTLYDKNNNGNFEIMEQTSQTSSSRKYTWIDSSDNKKGNYDMVRLRNYVTGGRWYERDYDFNKGKTVADRFPISSGIFETYSHVHARKF